MFFQGAHSCCGTDGKWILCVCGQQCCNFFAPLVSHRINCLWLLICWFVCRQVLAFCALWGRTEGWGGGGLPTHKMVTEQLSNLPSLWTRAVLCATIVKGCFNSIFFCVFFLMWPMGGMEILSSTQPTLYLFFYFFKKNWLTQLLWEWAFQRIDSW